MYKATITFYVSVEDEQEAESIIDSLVYHEQIGGVSLESLERVE